MNIEEKARAYDEALERARRIKNGEGDWRYSDLIEIGPALTEIFPELRESEDERIRKELIDFIQWSEDRGMTRHDFHQAKRPSEWIAWLEKQKYDRMKPVYDNQDSFESALGKAWKDYNDSGARTVDGCEDNYVECAHAKGFREGYLFGLEKQKNKMNAEEHETVKVNINGIRGLFPPVGDGKYIDEYVAPDKTAEEKQKEQKPADEQFPPLEGLDAIKAKYYDDGFKNGFDEGVESVKPVEWSEEDADILNCCISSIEEAKENRYAYNETDGDTSYDREIAWLKSLRPSWKPSEEQMDALNALNCHGDLSYVGQQNQLISLYNDLKKL